MFRCQKCGKNTKIYEKETKIVIKKRDKEYDNKGKISKGWEIAKEIKVCTECYKNESNNSGK